MAHRKKHHQTMTEPLRQSANGSWPPEVVHLDGDSLMGTRMTIYKPDYSDDRSHDPAMSLTLYGSGVENLCKILDAWRVKLKFTEEDNEVDGEIPF